MPFSKHIYEITPDLIHRDKINFASFMEIFDKGLPKNEASISFKLNDRNGIFGWLKENSNYSNLLDSGKIEKLMDKIQEDDHLKFTHGYSVYFPELEYILNKYQEFKNADTELILRDDEEKDTLIKALKIERTKITFSESSKKFLLLGLLTSNIRVFGNIFGNLNSNQILEAKLINTFSNSLLLLLLAVAAIGSASLILPKKESIQKEIDELNNVLKYLKTDS